MKALVLLADGVEEIEAVVPIDVLRRAQWTVVAAALRPGPVTASRGVRLLPDQLLADVSPAEFDLLVVPGGGGGVKNLMASVEALDTVRAFHRTGKTLAAICAGPLVLQKAGVFAGQRATCHPDVIDQLTAARYVDEPVVEDGPFVTSQGAGTALAFALALVTRHGGSALAERVAAGMALPARWR